MCCVLTVLIIRDWYITEWLPSKKKQPFALLDYCGIGDLRSDWSAFQNHFVQSALPAYPPVLCRPDHHSHRHGCSVDFIWWPCGEFRRAEHVSCTVALSRDLLSGTKFQGPPNSDWLTGWLADWLLPHLLHVIQNYSATVSDCGFCRWPW